MINKPPPFPEMILAIIKICFCNSKHLMQTVEKAICFLLSVLLYFIRNKTNDLILNLTPENVTQHSRIVTTTRKGSSTPTKMSKIIGRQIH